MVTRIALGSLIGIFATLFIAQNDPWVQHKVGQIFTTILSETFGCVVEAEVDFCDIFQPRLYCRNITMRDPEGAWKWSAQTYRSGFSWLDTLKTLRLDLWVHMKELHAYSAMRDGAPAISDHVVELVKGPDLPIPLVLAEAKIRDAHFAIADNSRNLSSSWHCDAMRDGDRFRLHFYVRDGCALEGTKSLLERLKGQLKITTQEKNGAIDYGLQIDLSARIPDLKEYDICSIAGNWNQTRGRFQIQNGDRSLRINPLVVSQKNNVTEFEAVGCIPLSFLYTAVLQDQGCPAKGSCAFKYKGSLEKDGDLDGVMLCEDLEHPWLNGPAVWNGAVCKRAAEWSMTWVLKDVLYRTLSGTCDWNQSDQLASVIVKNESVICPIDYPSLRIHPQQASLELSIDTKEQKVGATYALEVENSIKKYTYRSQGSGWMGSDRGFVIDGNVGSHTYTCEGSLHNLTLAKLMFWNRARKQIASVLYDCTSKEYEASVHVSALQELCQLFLQMELQGEGTISCTGTKNDTQLTGCLKLQDATIRLPQTYNFINGAQLEIDADLAQRRIALSNVSCQLHNGRLESNKAMVWLNEVGQLQFIHAPLIIERCLVSSEHEFFGEVSGALLLEKKLDTQAELSGNLSIHRAQLKENLLSQNVQKKLFSWQNHSHEKQHFPLSCSLTIETKEPIQIDTDLLQANAEVDVTVKGPVANPIIEGAIQVPNGTIQFPYKPLHISKGIVSFVDQEPFNPYVEIVAKNKIKNHLVSLSVNGLLQDTTILLESTPPLTQEQTIGLLIAGAHEDTLDALLPSLLMQNMTQYLFSSNKSNFYEHYIKPWMRQVNVQLKPNFSDESARGGLRGVFEIVLNDRWRAMIEKNFSLTEDTSFELEYTLSDDVAFRVIRDERRDIGAEVEMRWKF